MLGNGLPSWRHFVASRKPKGLVSSCRHVAGGAERRGSCLFSAPRLRYSMNWSTVRVVAELGISCWILWQIIRFQFREDLLAQCESLKGSRDRLRLVVASLPVCSVCGAASTCLVGDVLGRCSEHVPVEIATRPLDLSVVSHSWKDAIDRLLPLDLHDPSPTATISRRTSIRYE